MKLRNYLFTILLLGAEASESYAGSKLPMDAGTGQATYRHTLKLPGKLSDENIFSLVQDWLSNAKLLVCQNGETTNNTCKNKAAVDELFNNAKPIQSLDPSSGRITAKGLIKYYGGAGSSIGAMYIEYYVVIDVTSQQLTASIRELKYHHYNQRTFAEKPIYIWQGGKPFDSADKLENLVNNCTERDIQDIGSAVNKDIAALLNDLQNYLQSKKAVDAPLASIVIEDN